MCLGRTHLLGGLALGLGAADAWGQLTLPQALAAAALAGGSTLLNDLDTPSSTASHSVGRFSQAVARGVQGLSQAAFTLTATRVDDRYGSPVHRGLTHTLAWAAAVGASTWQLARLGPVSVGLVALVVAVPGVRVLAPRTRGWGHALLALALAGAVTATGLPALAVGCAVGVGLLSHDLLDACTTMGVPLLWPLRLRGMRWRRVGLPRFLRFHTGGPVEPWVAGSQAVTAVLATPPALELIKLVVYK